MIALRFLLSIRLGFIQVHLSSSVATNWCVVVGAALFRILPAVQRDHPRNPMQHKGLYSVSHRIVALLFCMVVGAACALAQESKLTGARLGSPDHLLITTSAEKVSFQSVLSGDKRKVIITVKNAVIGTESRELNSAKGLLQTAFIRQQGKDAVIIADLRDTAGFTAVALPYSQSISVDFFSWNKLSASENAYRSGLLAWQNGAFEIAGSCFREAERAGHPDGTAFLGFLNTMAGRTGEGATFLQRALARKSTYTDIYGALAEIERSKNEELKAREFENQFVKEFGRLPVYNHDQIILIETPKNIDEPLSLSEMTEPSDPVRDSASVTAATASDTSVDVLTRQLRSMQGNNARSEASGSVDITHSLPTWLLPTLIACIVSLTLVGFMFFRGYSKWRKQQMIVGAVTPPSSRTSATTDAAPASSFDSDLVTALAAQENVASALYKAHELDSDRRHNANDSLQSGTRKAEENPAPLDVTNEPASSVESADELFDFSDAFYAARERTTERRRSELSKRDQTPSIDNPVMNGSFTAQLSAGSLSASDMSTSEMASARHSDISAPSAEENLSETENSEFNSSNSLITNSNSLFTNSNPEFTSGKGIESMDQTPRMLAIDDDSIAALARQIGIDPAIIAAQRRGTKERTSEKSNAKA